MIGLLRLLRWILGGLALIAGVAVVALFVASEWELARVYPLQPESARAAGPEVVGEGRRLAKLYGCTSCHGATLHGHLFNPSGWLVRNYAPNLTLLAKTYSDEAFAQAIKQGVRPTNGRALWGMPSQVFSPLRDDELAIVLAFVRAQSQEGPPNQRDWPSLQSRLALVINALSPSDPRDVTGIRPAPELVALTRRRPPVDLGPALARGRHLTQTICAECHGSDLKGDANEGAPDLAVAAAYSDEAFRKLMRTGASLNGRDLGDMSDVARKDFKVFTDAEIDAIHAYLVARAEKLTATNDRRQ